MWKIKNIQNVKDITSHINAEFDRWMQIVIREWDRTGEWLAKRMWDKMIAKDIVEYNYVERDMALSNRKLMWFVMKIKTMFLIKTY